MKRDVVAVENLFTLKCTSCHHVLTDTALVCPKCQNILKNILDLNEFQLLNIEPHTLLDQKILKQTYIKAQKSYHPDLSIKNPEIFLLSTKVSAKINNAFKALSCPFQRALAFLKAHEISPDLPKNQCPLLFESLLSLKERISNTSEEGTIFEIIHEINQNIYCLLKKIHTQVLHHQIADALNNTAHVSYLIRIKKDAKKQKPHSN